jgi:hypothetical protein
VAESGLKYESAVRYCILGDSRVRNNDLEDDEYRQAVYENVVSLLEDEFNQFRQLSRGKY